MSQHLQSWSVEELRNLLMREAKVNNGQINLQIAWQTGSGRGAEGNAVLFVSMVISAVGLSYGDEDRADPPADETTIRRILGGGGGEQ